MHSQRYWLADAHHQGFSPQQSGLIDPPALTQKGWDVWGDFGRGSLYDQARGLALSASAAVAWTTTASGGALDFAAMAANTQVDFPAYAPPARYTFELLFVVGTVQVESLSTIVESADPSTYDHQFRITAGSKLEWYAFGAATLASTTTLTAGMICHAVATYDGTNVNLYLNGKLENSGAAANGGYTGFGVPLHRLGYKASHGSFNSGTSKILAYGVSPMAYDAGQVLELWQRPFGQTTPRRKVRALSTTNYTIAAQGMSRAYSFGAATFARGYAPAMAGMQRRYSFGDATFTFTPAQTGDTHDGFKRRTRRERALDAAQERAREEWIANRNAVRLSLEAAMGMAVETADEPAADVLDAVQQAEAVLPALRRADVDVAALEQAQGLVARLHAAVEAVERERERLRALAEDDEEVLMLLRAL